MFDFVKFGSPDWPASPHVLNRHPYKHIILISTILKHSFSELRTNKQKQKKKFISIIVIYFCIPHYDTDNYVSSDFNIWPIFFKGTRVVWIRYSEKNKDV